MGLDNDLGRLGQAQRADNPPNLYYFETDATKSVPPGPWDVVVLSNVLEHIADRQGFLRALIETTSRHHADLLIWSLVALLLGTFVQVTLGVLTVRAIAGPIANAGRVLSEISRGNLDHALKHDTDDEIGRLYASSRDIPFSATRKSIISRVAIRAASLRSGCRPIVM